MSKEKLIKHLENDIYCRLGISRVAGVGVIAIKDIPENINPFKTLSKEKEKIIVLKDNDLSKVNNSVKKLVKDIFGNNKQYDVLYYGPNYINISYYLNHSDHPNLSVRATKDSNYLSFYSNRKIKTGEELFINYNDYLN